MMTFLRIHIVFFHGQPFFNCPHHHKFIGFIGSFQIHVKFISHRFILLKHKCHELFKHGSHVHDFNV
jgi:hypothetical protein